MRLAIIADTHMPRGARALPAECERRLAVADLIVHAGDLCARSVLEDLRELGPPVLAVSGNVDSPELRRMLPTERMVHVGGARLAVLHDAGPARGRLRRMRRRFPDADAVVFGHSHLPVHEREAGFQIFNPGSPTERRRAPTRSMGQAVADGGEIRFRHIALDSRSAG